jgi:hypothetical protein
MELYIEKEFLDYFYMDYDKSPNTFQKIVYSILTDYGGKRVFIDVNFIKKDFIEIEENENRILTNIYGYGGGTLVSTGKLSIKEHLFTKSDFSQTLVFTYDNQDWFQDAENKGVLCFSFYNYQEKIKEIIDNLHFEIDLNNPFPGWSFLSKFQVLNFNMINISDDYIISDRNKQKIDKNLIPLLKLLLIDRNEKVKINILTDVIDPQIYDEEHIKEKLSIIYTKLNRIFGRYNVTFSIINRNLIKHKFYFHSRTIITNFSFMKSDEGFNLVPPKNSDGDLFSRTIFEKKYYDKLKGLNNKQSSYIEKIKSSEVYKDKFKMYP